MKTKDVEIQNGAEGRADQRAELKEEKSRAEGSRTEVIAEQNRRNRTEGIAEQREEKNRSEQSRTEQNGE